MIKRSAKRAICNSSLLRSQHLHDVHARCAGSGQQRRQYSRGHEKRCRPGDRQHAGHLNYAEHAARELHQRNSGERTGNDPRGGYHRALAEDAGQQATRLGPDGEADAELTQASYL